eukprot:m.313233 g.313233  ORF g.313233 m.313233 type:complete len:1382 (-) comp19662_c2_seq10:225-4370(-)
MPRVRRDGSTELKPITGKIGKDDLVRRLKALHEHLSNREQSEIRGLEEYTAALVQPTLLRNTSTDVRLHVSCCLAQVLRVYAPEAPYSEEELRGVLRLLIRQLEGLAKLNSATFRQHYDLLEQLSTIQVFILCVELGATDLIQALFKLFFQIVSPEHSYKVTAGMQEVMRSVLAEIDHVSVELFDIVFENIVKPQKKANPAAAALAAGLIKAAAEPLQAHVYPYFNGMLGLGKTSDSNMTDQVFELILEAYKISPTLMQRVVPQLEDQLKMEDTDTRLNVVELLGSIFELEGSTLATSCPALWLGFCQRMNDKDTSVRIACCQHAKKILARHSHSPDDLLAKLRERCFDPDETVRLSAVEAVMQAVATAPTSVNESIFTAALARARDKKLRVRHRAIQLLGQVFDHLAKRWQGSDSHFGEAERTVGSIPHELLFDYCLSLQNKDPETRRLVQRVFATKVFPADSDETRTSRLLRVFSAASREPKLATGLTTMLTRQQKMACGLEAFAKAAQASKKNRREDTMEELTDNLVAAAVLHNPAASTEQELRKGLQAIVDKPACLKHIQGVVSSTATLSSATKHWEALVEDAHAHKAVLHAVSVAFPLLNGASSVLGVLDRLLLCDDDDTETWASAKTCLVAIAQAMPGVISSKIVVAKLVEACEGSRGPMETLCLHVLPLAGDLNIMYPALAKRLIKPLSEWALGDNVKRAKLAAQSLASVFDDDDVLDSVVQDLLDALDVASPALEATLKALGYIALTRPQVVEVHRSRLCRFVVTGFLMKTTDKRVGEEGEDELWTDTPSAEVCAKVAAIKLMTRWLLGLSRVTTGDKNEALVELATPTFRMFEAFLKGDGQLVADQPTKAKERSRLRLAVACSLLKLATVKVFRPQFLPPNYGLLARTMQDPCLEVRSTFAVKLHKLAMPARLGVKFLAMLCLAAPDPDQDNVAKVAGLLRLSTARFRKYVAAHPQTKDHPWQFIPEYALPWLLQTLAHHDDFNDTHEETLNEFQKYFDFFFTAVAVNQKSENWKLLRMLATKPKQLLDRETPRDSERLYVMCDLAQVVIQERAKKGGWRLGAETEEHTFPELFAVPQTPIDACRRFLPPYKVLRNEFAHLAHHVHHHGDAAAQAQRMVAAKGVDEDPAETSSKLSKRGGSKRKAKAATKKSAPKRQAKATKKPRRASAAPTRRNASRSAKPKQSLRETDSGSDHDDDDSAFDNDSDDDSEQDDHTDKGEASFNGSSPWRPSLAASPKRAKKAVGGYEFGRKSKKRQATEEEEEEEEDDSFSFQDEPARQRVPSPKKSPAKPARRRVPVPSPKKSPAKRTASPKRKASPKKAATAAASPSKRSRTQRTAKRHVAQEDKEEEEEDDSEPMQTRRAPRRRATKA